MGDDTYSVEELEQILGVRARTIHFWVQSGLLEGPGAGRGARYSDEHLARLYMIQKLRAEDRPLSEIRAATRNLSAADLAALADQARAKGPSQKPRAKDLIRRWLGESASESAAPMTSSRAPQPSVAEAAASWGITPAPGESWTRVPLRDDVELHVRHPLMPESQALVDALLAAAKAHKERRLK